MYDAAKLILDLENIYLLVQSISFSLQYSMINLCFLPRFFSSPSKRYHFDEHFYTLRIDEWLHFLLYHDGFSRNCIFLKYFSSRASNNYGGTIRKVIWGMMKKQKKKVSQGSMTEKRATRAKKKWRKNIPSERIALSGLQTVAARLAIWQPLCTAVLLSCYPDESLFTCSSLQLEKRTFFPSKVDKFCV